MDLEEAKIIVTNHGDWPPLTCNPYVNFLFDVAQRHIVLTQSVEGNMELSDWEDLKEDYEKEVEVIEDADDIDPYSVEELKEKYL